MIKVRKVGLMTLVAALSLAAPVTAQTDVAGAWTLIVQAPDGPGEVAAVFVQDGTAVTGTLDIPEVGDAEMSDGLLEDGVLSFLMHVDIEGQWFTVEAEADVDGDEMVGEFYMAEFGSMPFTGKRKEG